MTTQAAVPRDPRITDALPLVQAALGLVGHAANRSRGTLGGSLANADPASELPAVMLALGVSDRPHRPGRPGRLHLRRIVRRAAATGGGPIHLPRRRRRTRALIDISGSMAEYSRALLLFAHAILRAHADTDEYTFGTRLTRVMTVLGGPSIDGALESSAAAVADWEGGTRIGEALHAFLPERGLSAGLRRSVVVIGSDGFDTGNPLLLAAEAQRLQRLVHAVVWLNPLKQDARYEPLARGMQAALWLVAHSVLGFALGVIAVTLVATVLSFATLPLWYWSIPDGAQIGLWNADTLPEALAGTALAVPAALVAVPLLHGPRRGRARRPAARRPRVNAVHTWVTNRS